MSQRKISMFNGGDTPQRQRKSQYFNEPIQLRRREKSEEVRRKKREQSSSSQSSHSSSSSSRSGSSESDESDHNKKDHHHHHHHHHNQKKGQNKSYQQPNMQARKSQYLQQEKLKDFQTREIQQKQKVMIMKRQRKIELQEDQIEDLQNELEIQKQNAGELNKQREMLRVEAEKVQNIEQEKNIVQSNLDAQKQRVQTLKRTIMKRQSTLMDVKADNFNKALNKDKSRIREVGNTILFIFGQLFFAIQNQYLLSKYVYRIANSSGSKSQVYFSKNAFLLNNYLFSLLILVPFYVMFFMKTEINGIGSFFLYNYDYSFHLYVSLTLAFFFLFQFIIAIYKYDDIKKKEVGQEAKKSKKIIHFKIVFGDWNWKINDRQSMVINQISLTKRVKQYFSAKDIHYLKYLDENAGFFQKFFFRFLAIGFIVASIVPVILIQEKEIFFGLIDVMFVSEIINGIVIACISRFTSLIVIPLNKFEGLVNQDSRMKLLYLKKFFSAILPVLASILMSYSAMLNDNSSLIFEIGDLTNEIEFNSSKYVCRENQVANQLVGLLIGYFLVSILYSYIPSMLNSVLQKSSKNRYDKQIQYDSLDPSVSLLVMNTIFLSLLPFSFFAIFLFIFILLLSFLNEWLVLSKFCLPQFSGLSSTHIKGFVSFFYNFTLLFSFCYYSFIYVRQFTPVYHTNDVSKLCNPFMVQPDSLMQRWRTYLYSVNFFGVIYDIFTWLPLVYGLLMIYFVAHFVSVDQKKIWEKEFQKKLKELSGIKSYYESRIGRLEKRIDDANKLLDEDPQETQENDDDYNINIKQPPRNRGQKSTLSKFDQDESQRLRQATDTSLKLYSQSITNIPKMGSISSTNIPQSTKFINQRLATEVKELDMSSKEDFTEESKMRKSLKKRSKNFF